MTDEGGRRTRSLQERGSWKLGTRGLLRRRKLLQDREEEFEEVSEEQEVEDKGKEENEEQEMGEKVKTEGNEQQEVKEK